MKIKIFYSFLFDIYGIIVVWSVEHIIKWKHSTILKNFKSIIIGNLVNFYFDFRYYWIDGLFFIYYHITFL